MTCPNDQTIKDEFATRYTPVTESGCWLWDGRVRPDGYAVTSYMGRHQYAHRMSYMLFNGAITNGLQIDHLCRVRCCVNPAHLEAVTQRENLLRGVGISAKASKQTHCINGHELRGDNLLFVKTRPRKRICRACNTERLRRRRQREML